MNKISIERKKYAEILDRNVSSFKSGLGKNIAILGSRKSGKTYIAKKLLRHKEITSVYVDLEKISLSPESFAVEFTGNICFWLLQKPASEYKNFLEIGHLLKIAHEIKSPRAIEIIKLIQNEISKIKPEQRLLVQLAFSFATALANEKKRILVIIDNFENILNLNNFAQIKDVLSLINFNHEYVEYVITSSAFTEIKKLLRNFEFLEIQNFDRDEVSELVKKFTDKKISDEIYLLSNGNPAVVNAILKAYSSTGDVKGAFVSELLSKNGSLYNYCLDSLNYYLNRTPGQVLSKIILKAIAFDKELRLSEIARKIYRSAPVTKSLLERLISADIIYRKDGKFYFHNPILKLWLKLTSLGYEYEEMTEQDFKEVLELI